MKRIPLVVATRSLHKLREIQAILAEFPQLAVVGLEEAGVPYSPAEEELEPYDTFEENARSKALYYFGKTGLPTVADDSGLEVEALGGAPGVRSKRFAPLEVSAAESRDQANNRHLLALLAGVHPEMRGARYVCVAALVLKEGEVQVFRGEAPGRVLEAPRGSGGFGYDPLILDEESGRSFAELSPREKNERSHRGRAFRSMAEGLLQLMGFQSSGPGEDSTRPDRWEREPATMSGPARPRGFPEAFRPSWVGPTSDGAALEILWRDGHRSVYRPRYLRLRCPCAGCVDEYSGRRTLRPEEVPERIFPSAIHWVGRYALQFVWSDGHDTGFFAFDYLRAMCPCPECGVGERV